MHILCLSLSTFDKIGGIQTFNKYFYKALNENKLSYNVISLHDKNAPNKLILACNSNYFKFIYLLFKYSNSETIIIWQHISLAVFLPFLKLFSKTKKNIITLYGTEVWGKNLSFLKKIGLVNMDYHWSISNYTADQIFLKYNIPKEKIKIFPCCIDIPRKLRLSKNPYNSKEVNILSILRLDKSGKLNAIYDMLKAIPILQKKSLKIHYTIIGDGNYKSEIIKEIRNNNLQDNVSVLGYVNETSSYLEHCDIFTLTSPLEGFGIVYLEAMSYQKPCIASKNCGSEDVVLNNKTGYSINNGDIDVLVNILNKLVTNKSYRICLGNNGYKHLIKNFTFYKFKENQMNFLL